MTSSLPMSNHETRPKPAIRRNRDPLCSELPYIREEKALNDSLIARLQQEVYMRTIRLRDARTNVGMKGIECEHAELRLKTTTSIRDKLVKTRELFTLSANLPTSNDVEQIVSGLEDVSPNLLAVADSLNMGSDFTKDLERRIEEANLAVRLAQDAVARSLEEEQEALVREGQCTSLLRAIQTSVDEISTISRTQESRAIFRVHDEIWRAIFLEVVKDAEDSTNLFPSIAISAVSYSWRMKALAYPALWKKIHIKVHGFTRKDVDRILQYRQRSRDSLLRITLQCEDAPSDRGLALLLESLTGIGTVDTLLIQEGPGGAMTNGGGTSVIWSTLQAIRQLKKLEITYPSALRPSRHRLPPHIIEGLEELILNNSGLTQFKIPEQAGGVSRLVRLALVRQASSPEIRWDHFCNWLEKSAATLEHLQLEATFSDHQRSDSAPPAVFSRLTRVITIPDLLLRFLRSSVHTPAIRTLIISRAHALDVDAWQRYAADVRGGKGIANVGIAGEIGAANQAAYSSCLMSLPLLKGLLLWNKNVEPLLEALTSREDANENSRPLPSLKDLRIFNYTGDGDNILLFAIKYEPASNTNNPSSGSGTSTLCVRLENCPNISSHVLRHLREIGSID